MLAKQILCSILCYSIAVSPSAEGPVLHKYVFNPYKNTIYGHQKLLKFLQTKPLSCDTKIQTIIQLIGDVNPEEFSIINPSTGQALIHQFTTWHWNKKIIAALVAKGVDMTIQTQHPDKFPGSTIAHSIAFINNNKHYQIKNPQLQHLSKHIKNSQHFIAEFLNQYPQAITLHSYNERGLFNIWESLHPKDKAAVYYRLTPETIQAIHQTAQQQSKQGRISFNERNFLLREIPPKLPQQNQHA